MNLLNKEILLVDKPAGMSSFGVVARVRRILTSQRKEQTKQEWVAAGKDLSKLVLPKKAKVGHAGTLDPFATGLLVCLLGKGTKKATEFLKLDKRYTATICLGKTSTTGDIEGEIIEQKVEKIPSLDEVQKAVKSFEGEIIQRVPAYSAVKIEGRRAYDLARKGIEVEMPERKVTIYEISILDYKWPELKIDCKVSSGTYIRTLGEDIGAKLGVGGYLTALRRTEIGNMKVEDAVTLEEIGVEN
ncbi:tRNA pseudouridine(55) synthase TruB [Candidatus Saccharibacteria bacterium]|nr:tRNA pseudouridine(55) synthase TruB [Candidatus Saccharibacteria bacterium]